MAAAVARGVVKGQAGANVALAKGFIDRNVAVGNFIQSATLHFLNATGVISDNQLDDWKPSPTAPAATPPSADDAAAARRVAPRTLAAGGPRALP